MARTIKQIYDQAAAEKASMSTLNELLVNPNDGTSTLDNSQRLLNDLTTPSRVGIWRLMLWLMCFVVWVHEKLWDLFKVEIESIVAAKEPGTAPWYKDQALSYQFGDPLLWDGKKYVYESLNTAAQIITRCSINDAGGIVRVKVAKGASSPSQLNAEEELAFTAYMNQIKFAGTNLQVISYPADQVRMAWEVFYNPLLQPAIVRANVEAAIAAYLANIQFDGKIVLNSLIDAVQQAEGVVNPVLLQCDTSNISSGFTPVSIERQSLSGYFIISTQNPLSGFYDAPANTIPVIKLTPYV